MAEAVAESETEGVSDGVAENMMVCVEESDTAGVSPAVTPNMAVAVAESETEGVSPCAMAIVAAIEMLFRSLSARPVPSIYSARPAGSPR